MNLSTVRALSSVIIPCWNQLEFTRQCIAALVRQTRPDWELIVINNGSTDGTEDYLAGLQDASPVPVTVISNATNRGFPAAINQGLEYARGEYLVLLNNDVVVTDGWLDQLIGLAALVIYEKIQIPESETADDHSESVGGAADAARENAEDTHRDEGILGIEKRKSKIENRPVGLVGPMSNYAAPPQLVQELGYHRLEDMPAFAQRWREQHRGAWFSVPKLSGFCLLMKRTVYEAIGGLDECYGLGFFDDDDLAERARRAGFELAVAHDLFVHHFGSRTFVGNGIDANKLLDENAAKFAAKWGNCVPKGVRVSLRPFTGQPQTRQDGENGPQVSPMRADESTTKSVRAAGQPWPAVSSTRHQRPVAPSAVNCLGSAPLPSADRARVSLTMIVRDEQENIANCLGSVRGLFDEIVVVDTGSKDRTIEVARSFGARVFDFVWVDDFAAARNAALARATGDYAFWLDADDLIEPPERTRLEALLARLTRGPELGAFVVRCACDAGPDGSGGDTVVDHIRLFPLIEGVRWSYRVHEQILPALNRAGVPNQWTDITVRHTGYADRALRSRKLDRDLRILNEQLAERPDEPFTLFNLGAIGVEHGRWTDALGYLKRSLAHSAPTDSITRKLFTLIARCYQMLGDFPSALRCCVDGLSLDQDDAELWFRKAVVHRQAGEPAEAEQCWRRILTLSRAQKFASIDQGIFGHLTRRPRRSPKSMACGAGGMPRRQRSAQAPQLI
jgi:glycosyltransferase involved in cell wall biosynthesis